MGRGHFMAGMQGLMALHSRLDQQAFAEASRRRADAREREMRNAKPSDVYGDGRLGALGDAQELGLFDTSGLYVGGIEGRLAFFGGDGHLLTYARTGSGKGRDLILPNLAHLRGRSLVVVDVKDGENAFASRHHRSETLGERCIYLNPFGLQGLPNARINPLQGLVDRVARGEQIDTQADEIAHILLPPQPKDTNSWVRPGARRLLATRMEYLAHFDPARCTLAGLWEFVNAYSLGADLAMMMDCGLPGIEGKAGGFLSAQNEAPKQFEAYKEDAIAALASFEPGKTLAASTAANDFDFGALKTAPHTVYLIAPSEKLEAVAPWVSLVLNHAIEAIAGTRGPLRTTFLLDEFPQLPPAPAIMKALRLYRGKGIQLWFYAQGRFSLEGRWSREAVKEFEDQASLMNFVAVEEPELLRDIEKWSGNETVLLHGVNHSGGVVEAAGANLGEGRRSVLQSEGIRAVGAGRQIIKIAGWPHLFVCDRPPFYAVAPWGQQIRDVRKLHSGEEN